MAQASSTTVLQTLAVKMAIPLSGTQVAMITLGKIKPMVHRRNSGGCVSLTG